MPSPVPKEDTLPRCQTPAEAPKLPNLISKTRVTSTTTCTKSHIETLCKPFPFTSLQIGNSTQALPLLKVLTFSPDEDYPLLSKLTSQKVSTVWRRLWETTTKSHSPLPVHLAPSSIRPRRLFFTPHSAMPIDDSHDTQHHTPCGDTSRRKPSADVNLQAEVERLRASVAKMSEKYEHLHTKNILLDHDYRTLKCNWEMT
ncbi:unnamed protein product [Prunus armeniaca]